MLFGVHKVRIKGRVKSVEYFTEGEEKGGGHGELEGEHCVYCSDWDG